MNHIILSTYFYILERKSKYEKIKGFNLKIVDYNKDIDQESLKYLYPYCYKLNNDQHLINPAIYRYLELYTRGDIFNILNTHMSSSKEHPYHGKGMRYFKKNFKRIIEYYHIDNENDYIHNSTVLEDYKDAIFFSRIPYINVKNQVTNYHPKCINEIFYSNLLIEDFYIEVETISTELMEKKKLNDKDEVKFLSELCNTALYRLQLAINTRYNILSKADDFSLQKLSPESKLDNSNAIKVDWIRK